MKQIIFYTILLVAVSFYATKSQAQNLDKTERIERLTKDVYYLADDKLKGRLTGTKGAKLAAKYISKEYKKLGLTPLFEKDFKHEFSYSYNPNPHGNGAAEKKEIIGNNVVAYLDNGANRTILIGAHYDHLGGNEHHNSTDPNSAGQIHNGADDNASGVAVLLELARALSQNDETEKVNYIFACFSGEEDGLIGSKALALQIHHDGTPLHTMINMDMLGRMNDKKSIIVGGVGTSPSFVDLVKNATPPEFTLTLDSSGIGPTDHTSFYLKEYPVLSFFTGSHSDYHKPTDDADKINYEGMADITAYIHTILSAIEQLDTIPFTKTKVKASKKVPRYKVTLGIMPDYADYGDGLHIDAVTDERPAFKAGLKTGDVLLKIDDCEVKEVYSYMGCLAKFKSGQTVLITYKREGKVMTTNLTF
ncbi:MAG: peptidase M28 [Bacteroidetes bacterium]|nr:MAG: peptidase M28 [Bacteroidota bacterium]